jgi:4-hydroxy-tetrahydrodipicolinate synthase
MEIEQSDILPRLRGIIPSQNTPFLADGTIDFDSIERLTDSSIRAGVAGFLITAVASEGRALLPTERQLISERFLQAAAGRVPIVIAVSSTDLDVSVHLAGVAAKIGADAICWQVPVGVPASALNLQVGKIAAAFPGLLMLQDLDFGGPGMHLDTIQALYEQQPRFRAIKVETVPAGPKYTALKHRFGDTLNISGGWAVMQMPDALQRGVDAFMPTAMDNIYVRIHRLHSAGRTAATRELFERLLPIVAFSNQHIDVSIRFFKLIRHMEGTFRTSHCRPPIDEFDPIQSREAFDLALRAIALDRECATAPWPPQA